MTDLDPFDTGVPRNGRGEPQIIPLKRGKPDTNAKLVSYTRASTFAKALDDSKALGDWRTRNAVIGVAISPDLANMIGALGTRLDDYTPEDKRNLDAIIENAHDRAGGNVKANHGTAVHSLTEDPFDVEPRARYTPEHMAGDVEAYRILLDTLGIETVSSEVFVVNDELKVAGTFDHVYRLAADLTIAETDEAKAIIPAGTLLLGDKKTGTLKNGQHAIQLAVYARGKVYEHNTGARTALDVSPQWGLVVHIPKGKATAAAHVIDLHAGYEAAKLALKVREYRSAASQRAIASLVGEATAPVDSGNAEIPSTTETVESRNDAEQVVETVAAAPVDEFGDTVETRKTMPTYPSSMTPDEVEKAALETIGDTFGEVKVVTVFDKIAAAPDRDECHKIWRETVAADASAWTDEHTEAVKARLAQLAA